MKVVWDNYSIHKGREIEKAIIARAKITAVFIWIEDK
jgi:hypothetical protein